jgi:hypothetical protein
MNLLAMTSADLVLWALGSTLAVGFLMSGMVRRRKQLTERLREHVEGKLDAPDPGGPSEVDESAR